MSIEGSKNNDHKPLSNLSKAGGDPPTVQQTLRPAAVSDKPLTAPSPSLVNLSLKNGSHISPDALTVDETDTSAVDPTLQPDPEISANAEAADQVAATRNDKKSRKAKRNTKDRKLLTGDRWLVRNGHFFTYIGLYLFSIMVLFRPYELIPGLSFLSATAFYFALATLAIFIPSQLAIEGNLTTLSTEVKAILAMTFIALLTIPIAKDPDLAWTKFNDPYIKAVVIFIVLVNVVRTRRRLMGMMWLSFGIGIYLSYSALDMYMNGKFTVEEYRVAVDVGGMFGNPNEMAMHFVMMTPLVLTLGIAAKSKLMRWTYFAMAAMFVGANMVTYSRGGFLGLLGCSAVLAWKLGRKYRLNVTIASVVVGTIAIIAAPRELRPEDALDLCSWARCRRIE